MSTPPYIFMAQCLVKHRDNFTSPYYKLYAVNVNMLIKGGFVGFAVLIAMVNKKYLLEYNDM
jgi:hypothetical protein